MDFTKFNVCPIIDLIKSVFAYLIIYYFVPMSLLRALESVISRLRDLTIRYSDTKLTSIQITV